MSRPTIWETISFKINHTSRWTPSPAASIPKVEKFRVQWLYATIFTHGFIFEFPLPIPKSEKFRHVYIRPSPRVRNVYNGSPSAMGSDTVQSDSRLPLFRRKPLPLSWRKSGHFQKILPFWPLDWYKLSEVSAPTIFRVSTEVSEEPTASSFRAVIEVKNKFLPPVSWRLSVFRRTLLPVSAGYLPEFQRSFRLHLSRMGENHKSERKKPVLLPETKHVSIEK